MNLTHDLSFLKDVSKNDRKLICGGGKVSSSFTGDYSSSSSSSSSSFVYSSSRDGVSRGSGRTSSTRTINGVVVKSDDKSFNFGPISGPFSFSIESTID
jgi:hypothetical protein